MVITQISAASNEDGDVVFGISDDQKIYLWTRIKSTRVEHEPDGDGDTHHYEHEWGWKPYEP